ncbi:MAG: cyclic nucleotide-binding domain-containing protein [Bacteroidota bacterium]
MTNATDLPGETKIYKSGETIIHEGAYGDEAYELIEGKVEVFSKCDDGDHVVLAHLRPPHIFGEMALIEEKPRSANVRAIEPTIVRVMNKEQFRDAIINKPEATVPILRFIFERLRTQNQTFMSLAKSKDLPSDIMLPHMIDDSSRLTIIPLTEQAKASLGTDQYTVDHFPFRIGRKTSEDDVFNFNDLLLNDSEPYQISPNHMMITRTEDKFVVSDRGSRYGLLINGKRIGRTNRKDVVELKEGKNELVLGDIYPKYKFELLVNYKGE